MLANSQLVCLPPAGISKPIEMFKWYAWELASCRCSWAQWPLLTINIKHNFLRSPACFKDLCSFFSFLQGSKSSAQSIVTRVTSDHNFSLLLRPECIPVFLELREVSSHLCCGLTQLVSWYENKTRHSLIFVALHVWKLRSHADSRLRANF